MLIDPFPTTSSAESALHMHRWIRSQIDIVGGWVETVDSSYRPRAIAINKLSPDDWSHAEDLGRQIGAIYQKVGCRLKDAILDRSPWVMNLCCLSESEIDVLRRTDVHDHLGATIRIDCIEKDGELQIIEVNTDNVAGMEDLILYLSFFSELVRDDDELLERIEIARQRVQFAYIKWLTVQSGCSTTDELRDRSIAVAYDDRYDSVFLARFVAAWLSSLGFNARACRPEHLRFTEGRLYAADVVGSSDRPIDILIRSWLFLEMFDYSDPDHPKLFPRFEATVRAVEKRQVKVVNPFIDRLLFSKAILAELWNMESNHFGLTEQEIALVRKHIPETDSVTKLGSDSESGWVTKPSVFFGGLGVTFAQIESPKLDGYDLPATSWIRQRAVSAEIVAWPYSREKDTPFDKKNLYHVQGLLMYEVGGAYELAGAMTRIGPDRVVNYSRGAQIVPSI